MKPFQIGRPLRRVPLLSSDRRAIDSDEPQGSLLLRRRPTARNVPSALRASPVPICAPDRQHRRSQGDPPRSIARIRTAYLQLGFVCLFVLLGALVAAEKLIIQPIETMAAMAKRFGQGDWAARVARSRLPSEFVPLARAFNAMAAQLVERERELIATNDRLTVMASIDMLSGLANRRGFQSRLDFEWMKAQQYGSRCR